MTTVTGLLAFFFVVVCLVVVVVVVVTPACMPWSGMQQGVGLMFV